MTVPDPSPNTKPSISAAVVLHAMEILRDHQEQDWPHTATEAIALLAAGRSQAYEMLGRLKDAIGTLHGEAGRPPQAPTPDAVLDVTRSVRDFLLAHPGAARSSAPRSWYGDPFRRHVLDLLAPDGPGATLTREQFADAVGIPPDTLDDWLRQPGSALSSDATPPTPGGPTIRQTQVATILAEWPNWDGNFKAFCQSMREQHRIPFGMTFVGSVLHAAGLRQRKNPRPVEAPWSPGTFRLFFPGAHWIGDGTTLAIWVNDHVYAFNAQANVDAASNALVAFDVTNTEDEQAVIDAYQHGLDTTGAPPLALTLDNRPSNLTPAVETAIAPTILLASTPGRGPAKAPIEGTFGLFAQTAPPLAILGRTERELARSILQLVLTVFAWTRNGKPRARLGGRTPRDFYLDAKPTPEDLAAAQDWMRELQRRQERIRLTREARLDPARIALLTEGLAKLDIPDPDGRIARQLAIFSRNAIVRGLATYQAKRDECTLPPDADHRFLGGIIRNIHERQELELTGRHLLEQRLRLRDLALGPLEVQAERIRESLPAIQLPQEFVDQALCAEPSIDFRFWMTAAAKAIARLPMETGTALYPGLNRRIAASFSTGYQRRADLADAIAAAITATA